MQGQNKAPEKEMGSVTSMDFMKELKRPQRMLMAEVKRRKTDEASAKTEEQKSDSPLVVVDSFTK